MPALALLVPVGAAAAWGMLWDGSLARTYGVAVRDARESGDYERMRLFERKLAQLGVNTQHIDFQTADRLAKDGNLAEAYVRMRRLARPEQPGYPPAHLWIIQHLFRNELKEAPAESNRLAGMHLDQLEAARIRGPQITMLRAEWMIRMQRLPEASALLEPLIHREPAAAMQRMAINMQLGDLADAKSDARIVRDHLEDRQRRKSAMNGYEYQSWALAEQLLGDDRSLTAVLKAWGEEFPDDLLARQGLGQIARRELDSELQADRPDPSQIARRIIEAAQFGNDPAELSERVAMLFAERDQSTIAQAAIEELLQSADAPPILLQLLGTQTLVAGDPIEASALLKRAVEQDSRDAVAWNNYACSLMRLPEADLDEALSAVEQAIVLAPNSPQFHETRGQLLLRLERWPQAVEDLEFAINGMPDSKPTHRALATAYAALGQQQLAAAHLQSAE
ncbi:MAG: hypothetical protein H0T51_14755 [Pirellulales bacterium]|nr:hypothetical protein [Pirellulales bacterium]